MSRNNSCITFPRNMSLPPRLTGIDSVMISNNQNSIDDCTEAFTNMSVNDDNTTDPDKEENNVDNNLDHCEDAFDYEEDKLIDRYRYVIHMYTFVDFEWLIHKILSSNKY